MTQNRIIQTRPLRNAKTVPDDYWQREERKMREANNKAADLLLIVVLIGILVELFLGK